MIWTEAMNSHVVALSMVFSKSFTRRRLRPSQANVRSTTQRLGRMWKPLAASERFDDFERPAADGRKGTPQLVAGIAAVGNDLSQPMGSGRRYRPV